jgi:undecaprenyl diphosphate synthase
VTPPSTSAPSSSATSPFAADPAALAIVERMRHRSAKADPLSILPDVHPSRIPRHIAIIMDGNGRWAQAKGFPRMFGHRAGAATVRTIVEEAGRLGVEVLTLYSFSMENWKRPQEEIEALMLLCTTYLEGEREHLKRENLRLRVIGRREGLPRLVIETIADVERATAACTGGTLCLAINYSSRAEIADAARAIADDVAAGRLRAADVNEETVASRLYTAPMGDVGDPDLLIRTAGELRVSNFLLWQISYAEMHVTPALWPDFGIADLHAAVRDFATRRRKFGAVDEDGMKG